MTRDQSVVAPGRVERDQVGEKRQLRRSGREHHVGVAPRVDRGADDRGRIGSGAGCERGEALVDANGQCFNPPFPHANWGSHFDVAVIISSAMRCSAA